MKYQVEELFDSVTCTWTYVVYDSSTKDCVIIDPVLDYNPVGSEVSFESLTRLKDFIAQNSLTPHYVLETHAHADHLSSSQFIKKAFPQIQVGISEEIVKVQKTFSDILEVDIATDGSQFDILLEENKTYSAGSVEFYMLKTPGHTPACSTLVFDKAVFSGDALFLPDIGTGRCDFPEGSAKDLYTSVKEKIYALPEDSVLYVGHDYPPAGKREATASCTLQESKESNKQLTAATTESEFLDFRIERDKVLKAPRLLYQSLQVNICAGHLPSEGTGGFFKLPVNQLN